MAAMAGLNCGRERGNDTRAALEKAAKDDRCPVSHLVQKIVADWLKKKGFLKKIITEKRKT
jgi:hypothetical protein